MSKKFNPAKYDPTNDSSPNESDYRPSDQDPSGYDGVILITHTDGVRACQCGCEQGNPSIAEGKTNFLQGHDARMKGILIRAHVTGTEVTILDGGGASSGPAMNVAKGLGWADYLKAAKLRQDAKPTRAAKGPIGEVRTVKVGRWEHEGVVIGVKGNKLEVEYKTKKGSKVATIDA